MTTYAVIVVVWFLFAAIGGITGLFATQEQAVGLAAGLPLLLFFLFSKLQKKRFDHLVTNLSPKFLIAAQAWRTLGFLFLVDYARGILPALFAFPAGLGDFAIGVTAPWVALNYLAKTTPRSAFVAWNIFGITDLVLAITLGILNSNPVFGIAGALTTKAMTDFPRSMIPTFFVPLLLIFHVITLKKLFKDYQTIAV